MKGTYRASKEIHLSPAGHPWAGVPSPLNSFLVAWVVGPVSLVGSGAPLVVWVVLITREVVSGLKVAKVGFFVVVGFPGLMVEMIVGSGASEYG